MNFQKILVVQTAFIGDAILMTPLLEALTYNYPGADIDVFINKNNQSLFENHPKIRQVWALDKKNQKYKKLKEILSKVRKEEYDLVINCHRYTSSGIFAALSKAKIKIGFSKNPISFAFTYRLPHQFEKDIHEVDRNLSLLLPIVGDESKVKQFRRPVLYPSKEDYEEVKPYQQQAYICIAPTSVWFTKQFPQEQWISFINALPFTGSIFLLGGKGDIAVCEHIVQQSNKPVISLAGKLSLLQSAVLMQHAVLNYVNDSAPLHLASAVNAPVCAVYCSTVTDFGFYPLSDFSRVVQKQEELYCRPCGLHGHVACPEGHFKCAYDITVQQLLEVWQKAVRYRADKKIS